MYQGITLGTCLVRPYVCALQFPGFCVWTFMKFDFVRLNFVRLSLLLGMCIGFCVL